MPSIGPGGLALASAHAANARARVRHGAWLLPLALGGIGAEHARAQQTATVGGSVVSATTHLPVEGARITVLGTGLGAASGADGTFELNGVPTGVRVVQARAVGFAIGSWMVELAEGQSLRQTFELEPRTIELESLTVRGRAYTGWRSEAGFDQRRKRAIGFFITRDEIQQRRAANVSDLLRVVPGVLTTCTARGCVVQMERGARPCRPEFFLDGYPATFSTGPNFPIDQIRGVEVYRDQFEAPSEFQRPGLTCGVIAIWTIEPGTPLERH